MLFVLTGGIYSLLIEICNIFHFCPHSYRWMAVISKKSRLAGYFGLIFMLNSLGASYKRVRPVTEKIRLFVFFSIYIAIKRFLMTTSPPNYCPRTMRRWPCWVSQTNPVGIKLFCCVKTFFCSHKFTQMLAAWVKTLYWPIQKIP